MRVLLDTHVWVWWLTPGSPLPGPERSALDASAERGELLLSAISLWEAQVLHAADERMLAVVPLDAQVVLALDALPKHFHGDPADRLIVATARAHGLALATHDAAIRRSRTVTLWKP